MHTPRWTAHTRCWVEPEHAVHDRLALDILQKLGRTRESSDDRIQSRRPGVLRRALGRGCFLVPPRTRHALDPETSVALPSRGQTSQRFWSVTRRPGRGRGNAAGGSAGAARLGEDSVRASCGDAANADPDRQGRAGSGSRERCRRSSTRLAPRPLGRNPGGRRSISRTHSPGRQRRSGPRYTWR